MTPLAHNIRELRMSKGMRQQSFGLIIGKSAAVISNYERGITKPDAQLIAYFAREAHVEVEVFTGRELARGDFCPHRWERVPIKKLPKQQNPLKTKQGKIPKK